MLSKSLSCLIKRFIVLPPLAGIRARILPSDGHAARTFEQSFVFLRRSALVFVRSSSIPIFVPLSARRREMTNLRTRYETNFTIMTRWFFSRGLLFRVTLAFPDCCWSASFFFDDSTVRSLDVVLREGYIQFFFRYLTDEGVCILSFWFANTMET